MPDYLELGKTNDVKEQELRARELEVREKALDLSERTLKALAAQIGNSSVKAANYAVVYAALSGTPVIAAPRE